jgi:hypothetical protein
MWLDYVVWLWGLVMEIVHVIGKINNIRFEMYVIDILKP